VSDQIDDLSDDSVSRAGKRRNPKKSADREIVAADGVPLDAVSLDTVPTVPLDAGPLAAPPSELADLFDPPLAGNEKREDFDRFFSAIAAAVRPVDTIAWLCTWDIVCLSWEIRRERSVKADIIKAAEIEFLEQLLRSPTLWLATEKGPMIEPPRLRAKLEARAWMKHPELFPDVTRIVRDSGYDRSAILAGAYNLGADNIDAIDRRLTSYETRRMLAMRTVENYNEKFAKNLDAVSRDVVDAEFKDLPAEEA
jgi:hypothetical protein